MHQNIFCFSLDSVLVMTVYFVMLLASGYIRKIGRISSIFFGYHISWKVK